MISITPARGFVIADHFWNNLGSEDWDSTISGGGSVSGTTVLGTRQHMGVTTFVSGTASNGRAKINSQNILLGGGDWFLQAIIQIPTLSTATDEFKAYFGFYDGTSGDGVDNVMFFYDRAASGDVWLTDTRSNTSDTVNSTGVSIVAGTWYRLGIEVNADASRAKFFVNGALVTTHTTNIPSGAGRQTLITFGARKTAGTTSTSMLAIDHLLIRHTLTNPLWTE